MIRILLADDQAIIREALKVLLEQESDFQIVGTANNGQTAIELVAAHQPDILLCDIEMPQMNGLTATQIICERFAHTKVIMLSSHAAEAYLTKALRAGAKGYLLKDTAAEDLASTIRLVQRGHSQLGPGLFEKILNSVSNLDRPSSDQVALEVLGLGISEPEFQMLLARFDAQMLPVIVDRAIQQKVVAELLTRVGHYLEDHPTSLSALYLSGSLLNQGLKQQEPALPYLRFGFREGILQNALPEQMLLFYQEGMSVQPEVAFGWLTQAGSPWNHVDQFSFLLSEAEQWFGADSPQFRALLTLREIKVMSTFSQACVELTTRLETLQNGFDRLGNVIKL
jgi:DNA-binding NarL/FixJ family response regulator